MSAAGESKPVETGAGVVTEPILGNHAIGRLFRNAVAIAVGRNLNALGRLAVAGLVVRGLGAESFGVYSVIVALLAIADWVLDFGTTDVFVRETVKNPARYEALRRSLVALKLVQAPAAMLVMVALLLLMGYSEQVVLAGVVAAASIGFFSGVAVYRSLFKASLTMEREMLAEFVSVLALAPLVVAALELELGIMGLMWALFASRTVFLLGCIALSRAPRALSWSGARWSDAVWLGKSSLTIGTIGLLIVVNNSVEILLLSHRSSLADVAYFSAAQKLVWPVFMALSAIGTSYYPVFVARYHKNKAAFHRSCQHAFEITVVLGGLAFCGIYGASEFLLSLLGPDMVAATPALRALALMCVAKSVAAVLGPALYIVSAQRHAFRYFSAGLAVKAAAVYWIAGAYGFVGTAYTTLGAEALMITPVTLFYLRRFTGFSPRLGSIAAAAAAAAVSIAAARALLPPGRFECGLLAAALYAAFVVSLRVVDLDALKRSWDRGIED